MPKVDDPPKAKFSKLKLNIPPEFVHSEGWQEHKSRFSNCVACELCHTRTKTCLYRGAIPCDALIIGEAPGASEDVLGKPFVGPAGKLLDELLASALHLNEDSDVGFCTVCGCPQSKTRSGFTCVNGHGGASGDKATIGYTNLIACAPFEDGEIGQPSSKSVFACNDRLRDIIHLANPGMVVLVGTLSKKFAQDMIAGLNIPRCCVTHPAAILRTDVSRQQLACQEVVSTVNDCFETSCIGRHLR